MSEQDEPLDLDELERIPDEDLKEYE